jgi:SHS2 domain-containing protein
MIDPMVEGDMGGKGAKRQITIEGEDYSDLMVRWLGEILYLFAAERQLVWGIEITAIGPNRLHSLLALTGLEERRHEIRREIKAVTYHQIAVDETPDGWKARVIFDI